MRIWFRRDRLQSERPWREREILEFLIVIDLDQMFVERRAESLDCGSEWLQGLSSGKVCRWGKSS